MKTVPVLLYHAVTTDPGELIAPFTVTPRVFEQHMDLLVEDGYECITFSALMDLLALGEPTDKVAVITFDDGYADFATNALPTMVERNFVSTLYVTTGFLEGGDEAFKVSGPSDAMLDWKQLPDLVAAGTEIGAHSHRHPQLDTLSRSALKEETYLPKRLLEEALGARVRSYAYPHGYNGARVQRATKAAGYDNAAGVRNALTHRKDDPFNVARLMVQNHHSIDSFRGWLEGSAPTATSGEALKTKGWRSYRRSKSMVSRKPGSVYQ